jgi:hypothetical protein
MKRYDPLIDPDPEEWLALDEQERIQLVRKHHRRARVELENPELHASIHAIVENQVARGDELPARRTLVRLQAEGLDRHEAIHAIGSVLAQHMLELLEAPDVREDRNPAYWAEVERLSAESWKRSFQES